MHSRRSLPWLLVLLATLLTASSARSLEVRNARVEPSRFSPNGDGVKDTAYISFDVSDSADYVYFFVYDANNTVVGARGLSTAPLASLRGTQLLHWTGLLADGQPLPEGTYSIRVGASIGGVPAAEVPLTVSIDLTAPRIGNVSVPSPVTPTEPTGTPGSRIQFTAIGIQRGQEGVPSDTVLVWVEKSPGPILEPDDSVPVVADSIRADTTWYHAVWAPADTVRNDGIHTVHIEALDAAGNHGGGGFWSVDMVLHSPSIMVTHPMDPVATEAPISLAFIPDTLRGTVRDRSGVSLFAAQFGAAPPETLSLVRGAGDTLLWSVPVPDSVRKDGTFEVVFSGTNIPGVAGRETRTYVIDTAAPAQPIVSGGIRRTVRRESVGLLVSAVGADSVVRVFVPAGGVEERSVRRLTTSSFTDSLHLSPGANFVSYTAEDAAGNTSAPLADSIFYDASSGFGAPQSFRSGDAFTARLDGTASTFEVHIYRPDGGFVKTLATGVSVDGSRRNFEIPWDLTNNAGIAVGRGPYICVFDASLDSGERRIARTAVVAMP